jgi:hypothetical protein
MNDCILDREMNCPSLGSYYMSFSLLVDSISQLGASYFTNVLEFFILT